MNFFNFFVEQPLGHIIRILYDVVQNYGWAIILLTIAIRLITLPLGIKQHKSMQKTQSIQPLLKKLQAKYKDDPQKLNTETMKLYKDLGVSPFGGCLPMIIQMVVLFGLIAVVYNPITYVLGTKEQWQDAITAAMEINRSAPELIVASQQQLINFNFFGLLLSETPQYMRLDWYWVFPIMSALTTFLSSKIMQMNQPVKPSGSNPAETMMVMMPFVTLFFAFSLPSAMSLYWTISSLTQTAQQLILNQIYKPLPVVEQPIEAEFKKVRRKKLIKKGGKKL